MQIEHRLAQLFRVALIRNFNWSFLWKRIHFGEAGRAILIYLFFLVLELKFGIRSVLLRQITIKSCPGRARSVDGLVACLLALFFLFKYYDFWVKYCGHFFPVSYRDTGDFLIQCLPSKLHSNLRLSITISAQTLTLHATPTTTPTSSTPCPNQVKPGAALPNAHPLHLPRPLHPHPWNHRRLDPVLNLRISTLRRWFFCLKIILFSLDF